MMGSSVCEIEKRGELSMRKTLGALATLLAFCAFAFGCGDGESAKTPSSEWVTIEGQNVSLRLPVSFKGGDPADPEVMSVLRGLAESSSNTLERESLMDWLDTVQTGVERGNAPSLMAWSAPDDSGSIASVWVNWDLLQNLLVLNGGDSSMRELVDVYMYRFSRASWELDSVTAREASVTVRYKEEGDDAPGRFILIKVDGDLYWTVSYECREASWDAWYETFKDSSETFELAL